MNRRRFVLGVSLALLVGVALRLWPLLHSPLPFNPDGIVYAGKVATAIDTGHLPLSEMAVDELQFTSFLLVLQLITGEASLYIAQPTIAIIGVLPVFVVLAAGRRLSTADPSWSRAVAVLAAGLLAVEGLYLHRSMAVDEQTLGLFFVPLGAFALARARQNQRWLVPLLCVLVVLPATHNLDSTIIAFLFLGSSIFYIARGGTLGGSLNWVLGALAYGLYLIGFSLGMARFTPAEIVQGARLTQIPGLLFAWLIVAVFVSAWFINRHPRTQRLTLFAVFGAWFAVLSVNAVVPVFPEMPTTNATILTGVALLLVPVAVASYGVPRGTRTAWGRTFFAQTTAVAAFIGIALTAALTPEYLNTIYRAQTFAHLPVLLFTALGVFAIGTRFDWQPSARPVRVLCVLLVVTAAASIPVAYSGLDAIPYKGVTSEAEFEAGTFTAEHVPGAWASDDHLTRITRYRQPPHAFSVLPVYSWLAGKAPPPSCPVLSQRSWTTTGGQFYPKAPAAISSHEYEETVETRNVVYVAGRPDTLILSTPQSPGDAGC
jgi:hypothetical protein